MSFDVHTQALAKTETETDFDHETVWVENLVTVAGTAITVLLVSSIAVLMYLA